MKMMTCRQLGGACDEVFSAKTFEEIADLSKVHGLEMFQKKEPAHLEAMQKMRDLMSKPDAMEQWFESKRQEFDSLPET